MLLDKQLLSISLLLMLGLPLLVNYGEVVTTRQA